MTSVVVQRTHSRVTFAAPAQTPGVVVSVDPTCGSPVMASGPLVSVIGVATTLSALEYVTPLSLDVTVIASRWRTHLSTSPGTSVYVTPVTPAIGVQVVVSVALVQITHCFVDVPPVVPPQLASGATVTTAPGAMPPVASGVMTAGTTCGTTC